MPMIRNLEISNFRAFKELKISDLSNINIFVGSNNSGKTTILEALFFIMGMSNPDIISKVSASRDGQFFTNFEQIQYLFHKLDYKNIPFFSAEFDNEEKRELKLIPIFKILNSQSFSISNNMSSNIQTNIDSAIQQLDFEFTLNEKGKIKKVFNNSIKTENNNQFTIKTQNDYIEKYKTLLMKGAVNNDILTTRRYSEILKRNKSEEKSKILELIKTVEPDIINIQPLENSLYFEIKGIEPLLPINIMGDGIRHLLSIYTAVLENKNSFILIDEIENGLHFSVYPALWKGLFNFAKNNDVQIFITTHSEEILKSMQKISFDGYDKKENLKLFKVANTEKNGHKIYGYEYKDFEYAIENDIELRK